MASRELLHRWSKSRTRALCLRLWTVALAASGATFTDGRASAEVYPDRTVKIVQPFPAGSSTDIIARGIGQKLSEYFGQPVIVEARPGANGIIGTTSVAKSPSDGYTMLLTTGSFGANAHAAKNVSYDAIRDFAPITQVAGSYGLVLLTNLPVVSVAELVVLAKEKAGAMSYATSGLGNITHVAGKLFEVRAGIQLIAVAYNTPALLTDVMTGTIGMTFNSLVTAVSMSQGGQLKALAITGEMRAPTLPDVPTMVEAGVKGYNLASGYFGMFFPAAVPSERVVRLNREIVKALQTPDIKRLVEDNGLYVVASTPDEFSVVVKRDYDYQGRMMDELGLRPK